MSDNDDDLINPLDALLAAEPSQLPVGPSGGFAPQVGYAEEPIPPAIPETFMCLRQCRYYMEAQTGFPAGNPKGSFSRPVRQITRYCIKTPGNPVDLTDENVFECNQWDPEDSELVKLRAARREEYYAANPSHRTEGN